MHLGRKLTRALRRTPFSATKPPRTPSTPSLRNIPLNQTFRFNNLFTPFTNNTPLRTSRLALPATLPLRSLLLQLFVLNTVTEKMPLPKAPVNSIAIPPFQPVNDPHLTLPLPLPLTLPLLLRMETGMDCTNQPMKPTLNIVNNCLRTGKGMPRLMRLRSRCLRTWDSKGCKSSFLRLVRLCRAERWSWF